MLTITNLTAGYQVAAQLPSDHEASSTEIYPALPIPCPFP